MTPEPTAVEVRPIDVTDEAAIRDHMIAINDTLGFEVRSLHAEFQRILPEYGAAHAG